jgi:PAS domain S-box-containing protein
MAKARQPTRVSRRMLERHDTRALIQAMLAGSESGLRDQVSAAYKRSGSVIYVMTHLVDAARLELQDMWYRGEIGVVDERRMLRRLESVVVDICGQRRPSRVPTRACILTATDELKGHLVRLVLEQDGWAVTPLSLAEIADDPEGVANLSLGLVVLVGDSRVVTPLIRSTVAALQREGQQVLISVPGHWAQVGRWHRLGAAAVARDTRTLLLLASHLHSRRRDFSISEVAASFEVTPHTIRAWERRYGLPPPARDRSAQRRYSPEDVELLLRISHAATVHGHSLRLASLEAQGLLSEDVSYTDGDNEPPPVVAPLNVQNWRRVADAVPELLALVDQRGAIVDCNIAMARMRDTVREQLRGRQFIDLVIDYDRAKAARLYRPWLTRRSGWELRLQTSDGEHLVVAFDSLPVASENGRLLGLIGRVVAQGEIDRSGEITSERAS